VYVVRCIGTKVGDGVTDRLQEREKTVGPKKKEKEKEKQVKTSPITTNRRRLL